MDGRYFLVLKVKVRYGIRCLEDWVARIGGDARLRRPDPIHTTNPFNGRPLTINPLPGIAFVWKGAVRIGMMSWSTEGLDEIVVNGAPLQVIPPQLSAI